MSLLDQDHWLTENLERPCFHLSLARFDGDSSSLESAIEIASASVGSADIFVDAKVPVDRPDWNALLETTGFHLIDTNVTLRRPVEAHYRDFDHIRTAQATDEAAVAEMARQAFSQSRFHLDPRFSADAANRVKETWARNYFRGNRGDHMAVAVEDGSPQGFIQLLDANDGSLVIDLIAVNKPGRGRGTARALIGFAEREFGLPTELKVGTQISNWDALRLYQHDGFQLTNAAYVYHYHGSSET